MFDTIGGLPVHILVVHAVVVLVPLMFLVTLAFTIRPKWRPGLPWAILGNAVATVAALVAKMSGDKLYDRLAAMNAITPAINKHMDRGDKMWIFALALLLASVVAWFMARQESSALISLAVALVLVCGLGATWWVYLTGDSGSRAVWGDLIKASQTK